ncbi:MAG: hypothetical protein H6739_33355 [Alphaproteobacteria bacterium]|nr:hypothetical protein [Alphaproteobacteria bacterium]
MYRYAHLGSADGSPIFDDDTDRLDFLERTARLGRRWGVTLLAFGLRPADAELIFSGQREPAGQWLRLLRSGFAMSRRQRGRPIAWAPSAASTLPDAIYALAFAHRAHRRAQGLGDPGSSLWDGLGLRQAVWFDAGWLQRLSSRKALMEGAGLTGSPPPLGARAPGYAPWPRIQQAVAAATGADPDARAQRVLRVQVAARCGWTIEALAALGRVGAPAIRRALHLPDRPALAATLAHLQDARLQAWRVTALPEAPCPHRPSCSPRRAGSSPAA